MVIPGGHGVQLAAGYARVMNADGSFTTIEVRAGDTSDEARRPILISERLSVEEMAPTVRDDDGMTIVAGGFHGHTAQIGTWVGPDGLHLDESEPAPPAPHSAEPVRYVAYRVVRFGHESHGALNAGPRTVDASDGEVEQLCRAMLSELLCGVDGDTAAAVRFAQEPASYRTIVGRFPQHHDGERHGMFLLMLTEGLRQIRVVGQCQAYRQAHSYDATALAIVPTSDIWFTDEAEMVARRTARALMRGAPALYAISETGAGFRGAYEVNTREENSELEFPLPSSSSSGSSPNRLIAAARRRPTRCGRAPGPWCGHDCRNWSMMPRRPPPARRCSATNCGNATWSTTSPLTMRPKMPGSSGRTSPTGSWSGTRSSCDCSAGAQLGAVCWSVDESGDGRGDDRGGAGRPHDPDPGIGGR